ncbi:MAG TPA: hypothetical protein VHB74_02170 [Devosia sp.]|nr:hypothetical protein [Devosia sp.]
MSLFGQLANLLGLEAKAAVDRAKMSAIVYAAIALFAVICLAFLLVTLDAALVPVVGAIWAPLIIAAAALVIALALLIFLKLEIGAQKRRQMERRREAEANALISGAAIAAVPELLRSPLVRNIGIPLAVYVGVLLFAPRRKTRR